MAFDSLTEKLQNIFKNLRGKGRLTEDDVKEAMKEIKRALLAADVNFKVVKQFIKAVELAKMIFLETLYSVIGKTKAKKIVLEKLKNTTKDYLELEEYLPYEETILKSEEGNHILFVMYPSNRGGYGIKTIKKSLEDKTNRLLFPESWAGLEQEELEKVSGIKDITFCHSNRFLVTCKTKEAAYEVLDKVLLTEEEPKKE